MRDLERYTEYDKYVGELYKSQNIGADYTQRDLYSRENYENLLNTVLEVLKEKKMHLSKS